MVNIGLYILWFQPHPNNLPIRWSIICYSCSFVCNQFLYNTSLLPSEAGLGEMVFAKGSEWLEHLELQVLHPRNEKVTHDICHRSHWIRTKADVNHSGSNGCRGPGVSIKCACSKIETNMLHLWSYIFSDPPSKSGLDAETQSFQKALDCSVLRNQQNRRFKGVLGPALSCYERSDS